MALAVVATFVVALSAAGALATTHTWTRGAGTASMSTPSNWAGGVVPGAGDDLIFPAGVSGSRLVNNDLLVTPTFRSITFQDTGYTLYGNAFSLSGGISLTSAASTAAVLVPVTLTSDQVFEAAQAGSTLELPDVVTAGFTPTLTGAGDLLISGIIAGSGGLKKYGSGTGRTTSSTRLLYTGPTTLFEGTLEVGKDEVFPSGSSNGAFNLTGGTLDLGIFDQTVSDLNGVGAVTGSGGTLTVNSRSGCLFTGVISGPGGLTKTGSMPLYLSGANSYTGPTSIIAGSIALSGGGSTIAASGSVSLATGTQLQLTLASETVNDLSGSGAVQSFIGGPATLTVNSVHDTVFSGAIDDRNGGALALTKTGLGTLTLSGDSDRSGPTTVNEGTLQLTGAAPSTDVTVKSGATFGGGGTVKSLLTEGGGTTWPGAVAFVPAILHSTGTADSQGALKICVADADGVPGTGFDQLYGGSVIFGREGTTLTLKLVSVAGGQQGLCAGWDPTKSYRWHVVTAGTTFAARAQYVVDASEFRNDLDGGAFSAAPDWGYGYIDVVFTPLARFDGAPVVGAGGDAFATGSTVPVTWSTTSAPPMDAVFKVYAMKGPTKNYLGSVPASSVTAYSFDWPVAEAAAAGWHVAVELWSAAENGSLLRLADSQSFAILEAAYPITVSAGEHGTITPGSGRVATFSSPTYKIEAATGYHIAGVTLDGSPRGAIGSYTFDPVRSAHTIAAAFAIDTFTITPSVVGGHGTISPATGQTVDWHATPTFAFAPQTGYHIAAVKVDGTAVAMTGTNAYTFAAVTAAHTISVEFAIDTFRIIASAGAHGSISPNGWTGLTYGGAQRYSITPERGYHVAGVRVDGRSVGALMSYAFTNVTAGHTISATFAIDTFTITPRVGSAGHGAVSPATPQTVAYGATPTFTFTPARGYYASRLTVDGVPVAFSGPNRYTFAAVAGSHVLQVFFTVAPRQALR
jgi:autotransporter-associated beta strand protein